MKATKRARKRAKRLGSRHGEWRHCLHHPTDSGSYYIWSVWDMSPRQQVLGDENQAGIWGRAVKGREAAVQEDGGGVAEVPEGHRLSGGEGGRSTEVGG